MKYLPTTACILSCVACVITGHDNAATVFGLAAFLAYPS